MTDLDLFKAITRAISGVPSDRVSDAVAKVRALFVTSEVERKAPPGRNRMFVGGRERSEDSA